MKASQVKQAAAASHSALKTAHGGKGAMDVAAARGQQATAAHSSARSGGRTKVGTTHATVGTQSGGKVPNNKTSIGKPAIHVNAPVQKAGGSTINTGHGAPKVKLPAANNK